MTNETDPLKGSKTKKKSFGLVRDVTAENYQQLGNEFIGANGGAVIALADGKWGGVDYTATPRQWGAWYAYFRAWKIPTQFMTQRGQDGKCWTVPAEWPHLFDADASVAEDHQAADYFMRNYRPPRHDLKQAFNAELRRAAVKRLRVSAVSPEKEIA